MPQQFSNEANAEIHRRTTGKEILEQFDGDLDAFIAGVGTGGTITGAGEVLKEAIPSIQLYAVEPTDSPVLSGGKPGPHKIQGIGAGFVPSILNTEVYDGIIQVKTKMHLNLQERQRKKKESLVVYLQEQPFMQRFKQRRSLVKGKRF